MKKSHWLHWPRSCAARSRLISGKGLRTSNCPFRWGGRAPARRRSCKGRIANSELPTPCASLGFVIARSDSDEAIQTLAQAALDCFACARNDEQATSFSRPLRVRALPTTTHKKIRLLQQKGGEAPKGACANHVRAAPTDVAI